MKKEQKTAFITLGVILLIVLAVGFYTFGAAKIAQKNAADTPAATSALKGSEAHIYTDLNGNPIDLSQYEGKVRVVNSWASWCPFCVNELPDLEKLAAEYGGDEVVVLAINRKENPVIAKKFLNKVGQFNNLIFVMDSTDNYYKTTGGFSMPETIFYDREGNIAVHKRGFMKLEEMKVHVETAISADQN